MPFGLNRTDLNVDHVNYRKGIPVTEPKSFGTAINLATKNFGNPVTLPVAYGNAVTLPKNFGNQENLAAGN